MFKYKIVDDFLDDFMQLRLYCDMLEYNDTINPVDSVVYPGINIDIPFPIVAEIINKLKRYIDKPILSQLLFFRLTKEGVEIPHQAHNDKTMGDYGLMLYLNRAEHCKGGTSFITHKETGLTNSPVDEQQIAGWKNDVNLYDKWQIDDMVSMRSNRAVIFNTGAMHRAEKPTAFGDCAGNGRLVLVCFVRVN